jgi:DNA-binding NtrC family response regulator
MSRSLVFMVCDDQEVVAKAKSYWETQGVTFQAYTSQQWREGVDSPFFRSQLVTGVPVLNPGSNPFAGSNVLPFPGQTGQTDSRPKVSTMDEMESKAIEGAIAQFRGNLTEAAKALGIGRATLYRKVKQYKIDPNASRRKRAA